MAMTMAAPNSDETGRVEVCVPVAGTTYHFGVCAVSVYCG